MLGFNNKIKTEIILQIRRQGSIIVTLIDWLVGYFKVAYMLESKIAKL